MKYRLVVRDRAVEEMEIAYKWYENEVAGLGNKFLTVTDEYKKHILTNPFQFKTTYRNFREIFI